MNRLEYEKQYWDEAAKDPQVDIKYICDIDTDLCLEELGALKGRVLEIGCGVGRLMKDGYQGIDISEEMLDIARQRRPKCNFKLSTGDIPFNGEEFDTVYSMLVFQHLKPNEIFKYIKESYRVLKEGGILRFQYVNGTEREPFSNHYTKEEIETWLEAAGFDQLNISESKLNNAWRWAAGVK